MISLMITNLELVPKFMRTDKMVWREPRSFTFVFHASVTLHISIHTLSETFVLMINTKVTNYEICLTLASIPYNLPKISSQESS
jgi:hypothetical protein